MNSIASPAAFESLPGKKAAFSDRIVDSLRNGDIEEFSKTSAFAACLFPILEAFGKAGITRQLLEAVPHFARQLDLIDLRNILVNLGYESDPVPAVVGDVGVELYPVLFVGSDEEVMVLTDRRGDSISYFDAGTRQRKTAPAAELRERGTAYLFTNKRTSHGTRQLQANNTEWFATVLSRFKKMIWQLLLVTLVINFTALFVPIFIMIIYDKVIGAGSLASLPMILSGVGILILSDLVLRYQKAKALGAIAGRLDYLIGVETFKQLLFLPPSFTERSTVASQLSRLKQFDSLRDFFTGPSAALALELPFVVLFLGVVAILSGVVAVFPLILLGLYIVIGMLAQPAVNRSVQSAARARTDKQNMLMQTFDGRREIKAIGGETVWRERFRELSGEAVHSNYRAFVASAAMNNVSQALMTMCGVAVLAMGATRVMSGAMSIGALIATMTLVWRVLGPLQGAFLSYAKLQQMLRSIAQINSLMRLKVEKDESNTEIVEEKIQGKLTFDRVSFRYEAGSDPALLGVSFNIEPGEMAAVVGYTGSGKSTLLKLIAGMYRPQAGALLLDGVDLRQFNAMELRRSLAYVPQEVKMFHGTIAQNMRLNNCMATDQMLAVAAEKAGILQDILRLPEGFDTRLGDKSMSRFPPGFMRSLSIARAFCCNAEVVLFDEPGSSLDAESDTRFMRQLNLLKGQHTIVMVSHRPSHIRLADKALLLENGSVKYAGSPDKAIEILMSEKR